MKVHFSQKSVYCFRIDLNQFREAPNLNKKRQGLASCELNGKIYAFAGWEGTKNGSVSSIERLNVQSGASSWELFNYNDIIGVEQPIMSSLSSCQILIAGGSDYNESNTFKAHILNESDMTTQQVYENDSTQEWCYGKAAMVIPGKVIQIGPGG